MWLNDATRNLCAPRQLTSPSTVPTFSGERSSSALSLFTSASVFECNRSSKLKLRTAQWWHSSWLAPGIDGVARMRGIFCNNVVSRCYTTCIFFEKQNAIAGYCATIVWNCQVIAVTITMYRNSSADLLMGHKSFDGSYFPQSIPYPHEFLRIIIRHITLPELYIMYSSVSIHDEKSAFFVMVVEEV